MDHSADSAAVFSKLAEQYNDKFSCLDLYDEFYREFCNHLRPGRATVLDAACGPGHVAQFLIRQRPELDILGIDLAPRMIELAQAAVPLAHFATHDCRKLVELRRRFDGILCAFGFPYLSSGEVQDFLRAAHEVLNPEGVILVSTMLGQNEASGWQKCSTGDEIYINYYSEDQIVQWYRENGLHVILKKIIRSPPTAAKATADLIVIGKAES